MAKKDLTFITTEGREVEIRPVSQTIISLVGARIEKEFRARGEPIDPPTYETTTAAGTKEILAWTPEMVDGMDEETREKWNLHLAAVEAMEAQKRAEQVRAWLLEGIVLPEGVGPDTDKRWLQMVKFHKLTLPEDEIERLMMYYETAIFKTKADYVGVTKQIMMISADGVSQEELSAIEDLFRRAMEGPAAAARAATDERAVDNVATLHGGGDGKSVGKDAERVEGAAEGRSA